MIDSATSLDTLTRQTGVLQQIQVLLADTPHRSTTAVTLADVATLVHSLQASYGSAITLEEVIQVLAGTHLKAQIQARRASRQGGPL
jgi:hypothetical protein